MSDRSSKQIPSNLNEAKDLLLKMKLTDSKNSEGSSSSDNSLTDYASMVENLPPLPKSPPIRHTEKDVNGAKRLVVKTEKGIQRVRSPSTEQVLSLVENGPSKFSLRVVENLPKPKAISRSSSFTEL
jgi:hypothetical protein